jgi:hypothetical protein
MSSSKREQGYLDYFDFQLNSCKSDEHHIIPSSRGGTNDKLNKTRVNIDLHQRYHCLFSNRTPEEILEFLVEYFWGGDISFVQEYLMKEGLNGRKSEINVSLFKELNN